MASFPLQLRFILKDHTYDSDNTLIVEIRSHKLVNAKFVASAHADARPGAELSLIVIHNISLPLGHFGTRYVSELFTGQIDPSRHPDLKGLAGVKVSSHLLIDRNGATTQFVEFDRRAWHAGSSEFRGRTACNDFSIGIELAGTDDSAYTDVQYQVLSAICKALMIEYKIGVECIVGHSDIAPGRKTDPGPGFKWQAFRDTLGP